MDRGLETQGHRRGGVGESEDGVSKGGKVDCHTDHILSVSQETLMYKYTQPSLGDSGDGENCADNCKWDGNCGYSLKSPQQASRWHSPLTHHAWSNVNYNYK